jgi:hypothetical protein
LIGGLNYVPLALQIGKTLCQRSAGSAALGDGINNCVDGFFGTAGRGEFAALS